MKRFIVEALTCSAALLSISGCSNPRDPPAATSETNGRGKSPAITNAFVAPLSGVDLVSLGESTYWAGNYDSARTLWRGALRQARAARDDTAEARILTSLGLAAWRKGDYPAARQEGESALSIKLRLKLEADLFKSYNALGLLAWNEGRLDDAAGLFDKAMTVARTRDDREGIAKASGNLALVHADQGEFAKARAGFEVMRQAGKGLKDARIEGNALNNLGMLQVKLGDPSSAISSLVEARRLYHSIEYAIGEQNALGQLGTAYAALGNHRSAFAALDRALSLSRAHGLRQEEASNLELIAELYREAGDIPRALRFYADAQTIEKELGLAVQGAVNLRNTAEIQASLGKLDAAMVLAAEALRMHRTASARSEEVRDLLFMAELSQAANQPRSVADYLGAAERLIKQLDWTRARLDLALTRARIADRAEEPMVVLRALASKDHDLLNAGPGLESEARALAARAHARLGSLDSAIGAGRLAVAAVERVRSNIGSGSLRNSYLSDREAPYRDLVTALLRSGRVEQALEVSDNMRGRALSEHLVALETPGGGTSAVQTLANREVLLRRIDALSGRFDEIDAVSAADRDSMAAITARSITAKLVEAREEYETLVIRSEQLDSGALSLLGGGKVIAGDIRNALREGESLLEYLVTPEGLIVFVVAPSEVRVVRVPIGGEDLSARVRLALGLIGRSTSPLSASDGVMRKLHNALLPPVVREAIPRTTRRLIIVPHSILSYIPYAALQDPATGRYLVEDFDVVGLPSAAALPALRNRKSLSAGASRDPVGSAALLAPFPTQLPGSRREAEAGARSIRGGRAYVGKAADESRLRGALGVPGVVHVATHGVMNARNPMFSRIELSRGATGGPGDDGRLEVHEVLKLRVRSSLVFLSGCETGIGSAGATHWSRGQDYATLAQAFLYAGTRDVIATLWKIEDEGAASFASRFYGHLRGVSPSDALARTQREMIRDSRFSAPYYWASYAISGEGLSRTDMQNRQVSSVLQR